MAHGTAPESDVAARRKRMVRALESALRALSEATAGAAAMGCGTPEGVTTARRAVAAAKGAVRRCDANAGEKIDDALSALGAALVAL